MTDLVNLARGFLGADANEGEPLMSSGFTVARGQTVQVMDRPQVCACRIGRIQIVNSTPAHWVVRDIVIGARRCFLGLFASINGSHLDVEQLWARELVVAVGQDFSILASYIGPKPEGEVFDVRLFGVMAT